jgi:hypothetical protein
MYGAMLIPSSFVISQTSLTSTKVLENISTSRIPNKCNIKIYLIGGFSETNLMLYIFMHFSINLVKVREA